MLSHGDLKSIRGTLLGAEAPDVVLVSLEFVGIPHSPLETVPLSALSLSLLLKLKQLILDVS